jgi:LysR substrate binding domain
VVLGASHRLAGKRSVPLERLAKEPFILSKAGCEPVLLTLFREAKVTPCIQFEIREIPTILAPTGVRNELSSSKGACRRLPLTLHENNR